ncbi:MAG: LLM class flavin-dependent oxidoreductase [Acidimicrobiales bacterium]
MLTRLGLVIAGAWPPRTDEAISFDSLAESVGVAECSGFDSIWVTDDPRVAGGGWAFEAYTLLGALALRTGSARLGALVTDVTSRPPALLAKQVTALDLLSSGRAVLGIGAGRLDPHEDDPGEAPVGKSERFERLEEALQIFRAMFTQDPVCFAGRYYQLEAATNRPPPVQIGGPPVLIGGNGESWTLRLVANYGDACNLSGDEASIRRKIAALEEYCVVVGRDPSSITKTMLVTVVVAPTDLQASERLEYLHALGGSRAIAASGVMIVGGPDKVVQQAVEFSEMGIDGFILNLPDTQDADNIALAATVLSRSF